MFEEWRKKLAKRDTDKEEDFTFKNCDDIVTEQPALGTIDSQTAKQTAELAHSDSVELKVLRPETYSEVSTVADNLLAGCTVVLNLEALDRASMVKMLDFLNGVTYCTDGEIKMVAKTTFIITPHSNVDISDM
jgi:cell division inhibitor SepF